MHMMNQNTFTGAAFHVTDAANVGTVADAVKENILVRQWMCGFPDKMVIATIGNEYVVASFGINDAINPFEEKLSAAYPAAEIVYSEAIA